jgi:hypothetical protein
MAWKYNPFTDALDLTGGGASYIDGVVADSSLLPVTLGTPALDSVYLAKAGSGLWLISRRPAGLYVRVANNGVAADWTYLGAFPEVNADANWELYNSTDPTKELKFDLSGLPTATIRTVTGPAGNGQMMVSGQAGSFTTLTANNGTLTGASAPVLDLAQTWNNAATTFTGLRFNATNTASDSNSLFAEFQTGGVTQFAVRNTGEIRVRGTPRISNLVGATFATWITGTYSTLLEVHTPQLRLGADGSGSTRLFVDGANIFAQRDGTAAQEFRVYNTFTSATNHERLRLAWASNVAIIGTEKGSGGGTARALEFQTDGVTRFALSTAGVATFTATNTLTVTPNATSTLVGGAAVVRLDAVRIAIATGGTDRLAFSGGGDAFFGSTLIWNWVQRTRFSSPADGQFLIQNSAGTDFGLLQFGGTTSSFPALKRSSTALQVRLADDTAFAPLSCGALTLNGNLDASTRDIVTDTTTGTKIGTGTTQKLGFFNATPAVQPAAVADATDAASTQDRLNDLLARLRTLGLIAT